MRLCIGAVCGMKSDIDLFSEKYRVNCKRHCEIKCLIETVICQIIKKKNFKGTIRNKLI